MNIVWPPTFKIKKHRLARNVKLRASRLKGLEITVPYRFNFKKIPAILEEHKTWITEQFLQFKMQEMDGLPDKLIFNAIQETWTIELIASDCKLQIVQRPHNELVLVGDVDDHQACRVKLKSWIKDKAKAFLISQINQVSEQTNLFYKSVSVRDQQTLWGSCTINKSISLNYKLIFLPLNLVRHILIHELCHTEYLNHSNHFWSLVEKHDTAWQSHRLSMHKAEQFIPGWLEMYA